MAEDSKQTFKRMKELRKKIDDHDPKLRKDYEKVIAELRSGIKDESEDEIKVSRPALDDVIERIDMSLDACEIVHTLTTKLLADKPFVATNVNEIKNLIKHVAGAKNRLAGWAKEARDLGDEADKALGVVHKGAKEVEAQLGMLKNRLAALKADVVNLKKDVPSYERAARAAHAKGDQKSVERARLAILDSIAISKTQTKQYWPIVEKFKKDNPDLDRRLKVELQGLFDILNDADSEIAADDKKYLELLTTLKAPAKPEKDATLPDVPKAELIKVAAIVHIDPKDSKQLSLLAKALNSNPHSKWAEALSKLAVSLKLKDTNGKAMVIAIDKLPYFRNQQLIDI